VNDQATLADRVTAMRTFAGAVGRLTGVVAVGSGAPGEPATFGSNTTVRGVAQRGDTLEVVIVAEFGAQLPDLADQIRDAARADLNWSGTVDVTIADVQMPEDHPASSPSSATADPASASGKQPAAPHNTDIEVAVLDVTVVDTLSGTVTVVDAAEYTIHNDETRADDSHDAGGTGGERGGGKRTR
jgi:uncharacterized alkaline shock family protein YloU